jgi:hypothetical protein
LGTSNRYVTVLPARAERYSSSSVVPAIGDVVLNAVPPMKPNVLEEV